MFYNGEEVEISKERAFEHFKLAADQGDINSAFYCGLMLQNGDGIEKNIKKAATYFKFGAENKYETILYKKQLEENQVKFKSIDKNISELKQIVSEQSKIIDNQQQRIAKLENDNISQKLAQLESQLNEQQLKNGTKLTLSENKIHLENDEGKVISTISIPSIFEKYSFHNNSGYIKLTNNLLIQWGRYIPSRWVEKNVKVTFPIPFIATSGGAGGDYNPAAEYVSSTDFKTGSDHQQPTTWIAIGT